ncbi:MAG: amidase [Alphaproteobacteria bacterium]|nr:amidase [Alphaproteobacteria bacterium]
MRQDRGAARRSPGFLSHVHSGYRRNKTRMAGNITRLEAFRRQAMSDWSDWDAMIVPVTGVCAFEHLAPTTDRAGIRDYVHQFDTLAGPLGYFDALTRFTVPVGLLGWPVITVPIGRDPNGLPMGAQLVGKPHSETLLLDLAQRLVPQFGFR